VVPAAERVVAEADTGAEVIGEYGNVEDIVNAVEGVSAAD